MSTQPSVHSMVTRPPSPPVAKPRLLPRVEKTSAELPVPVTAENAVTAEAAEVFIENKRIGDRIKFLRQRKSMGLVELGRHTGLSASFLSQLETGRVVPTLRNLARIAMVFSKDLSYFFEPERPELFRVVRAEDRQRLPQTGAEEPSYFFESLGQVPGDNPIAPYITEFLPECANRSAREHQHAGAEFLYLLAGAMEIRHQGRSEVMEDGDAVYFHANATHSYRCVGSDPCHALIVTMPELPRASHAGAKLPLMRNARMGADQRQRGSAA